MPRPDVNRFAELAAFVQVVERGGFSAAARALAITPSAVSKLVGRLEARLGTRLVHRSTRKLQLSAEGQQFYERGLRVLADLDDAERGAAANAPPRGRVGVNTSFAFGTQVLMPLVPVFLERHPHLDLDIGLTDRVVDLVDERADLAVRWGPLSSSDLLARRLGETGQAIVASPAYLARHGTPRTPDELASHRTLDFAYRRRVPHWPLRVDGRLVELVLHARVRASDGEALRQLALAGAGLARLSLYHAQADLDAGRLVEVLADYNPRDIEPIHAVYLGRADRVPTRVRAVLDFLVEHVGADRRFGNDRPAIAA